MAQGRHLAATKRACNGSRAVTQLEGQLTTTRIVIERLEYESERRYIRAPVAGRLGEVTTLRVGAMVGVGTRLGVVVPPGMLKIMADFLPPAALGRIQPRQPARLRLEGFPGRNTGSCRRRSPAWPMRSETDRSGSSWPSALMLCLRSPSTWLAGDRRGRG